jgi:hypothetical protein
MPAHDPRDVPGRCRECGRWLERAQRIVANQLVGDPSVGYCISEDCTFLGQIQALERRSIAGEDVFREAVAAGLI